MNWLELFGDTDEELSLEDVIELELEHLASVLPAMLLTVRKNANLTQSELADRMGCLVPNVSKLEKRSDRLPQLKTMVRYLNAAGARLSIGVRYQSKSLDVSYRTLAELKAEKLSIVSLEPKMVAVKSRPHKGVVDVGAFCGEECVA